MQTNETETPAENGSDILSQMRGKSLMGVQIEITISVGKTHLALADFVKLEKDSVLQLDSNIEDPVDIYVGDRLVARGELEETEDDSGRLAVRLTEVADLSDGL